MIDHTKTCFGNALDDQVWLDSIAGELENFSKSKFNAWSHLSEYYLGAHYALRRKKEWEAV